MSKRSKVTVISVVVTKFNVTSAAPREFLSPALIQLRLRRSVPGKPDVTGTLNIFIKIGYMTDGASTFWPISLLVPKWKPDNDDYNAAPVAHDVLYMLAGVCEGFVLSREEVDDILRGIWRISGMSRFVAGCADKGVEIFAGGSRHWGNDSYGVKSKARVVWVEDEPKRIA